MPAGCLMRRAAVCLALLVTALGLAGAAVCVAWMIGAESAAARAADGALLAVDLAALVAVSFLFWPRRA